MAKNWAKLLIGSSTVSGLALTSLMLTTNESVWENITIPLIQTIDAERAHVLAVRIASWKIVPRFTTKKADRSLLVCQYILNVVLGNYIIFLQMFGKSVA